MKTIEELREHRRVAWLELTKISGTYHSLEPLFREVEKQWKEAKKAYEKADYELALVDGRLSKVESTGRSRGQVKELNLSDLTEEQIDDLLRKFGIELPTVELTTEEEYYEGEDTPEYDEHLQGGSGGPEGGTEDEKAEPVDLT